MKINNKTTTTTTLPTFSIEGVGNTVEEKLQSLVEIEAILVMATNELGLSMVNESQDKWNNVVFEEKLIIGSLIPYLHIEPNGIQYHNHYSECSVLFKADQLPQILDYIYAHAYEQ